MFLDPRWRSAVKLGDWDPWVLARMGFTALNASSIWVRWSTLTSWQGKLRRKVSVILFSLGIKCFVLISSLTFFPPASLCAYTFPYSHISGWSSLLYPGLSSVLPCVCGRRAWCPHAELNPTGQGTAIRNACPGVSPMVSGASVLGGDIPPWLPMQHSTTNFVMVFLDTSTNSCWVTKPCYRAFLGCPH